MILLDDRKGKVGVCCAKAYVVRTAQPQPQVCAWHWGGAELVQEQHL